VKEGDEMLEQLGPEDVIEEGTAEEAVQAKTAGAEPSRRHEKKTMMPESRLRPPAVKEGGEMLEQVAPEDIIETTDLDAGQAKPAAHAASRRSEKYTLIPETRLRAPAPLNTPEGSAGKDAARRMELRDKAMEAHDKFKAANEAFFDATQEYAQEEERFSAFLERIQEPSDRRDTTERALKKMGFTDRYDSALTQLYQTRSAYEKAHADWEKDIDAEETGRREAERVVDELIASVQRGKKGPSNEADWFGKTEDEDRQLAEARATIEGSGRPDSLAATPDEIGGEIAVAYDMIGKHELDARDFDVVAYEKLVREKARLDHALEDAGWLAARRLRSELKETLAMLEPFERKISDAQDARVTERDRAASLEPSARLRQARLKGSGTTVNVDDGTGTRKRSFLDRLLGR
jgi:hypothetical protein